MPRPLPTHKKQAQLDTAAFKSLLAVIKKGRPVMDPRTGEQRKDENGNPVFVPASAADIAQARYFSDKLEALARVEAKDNEYRRHSSAGFTRDQTRAFLITRAGYEPAIADRILQGEFLDGRGTDD